MADPVAFPRIATLKSAAAFRDHAASLGLDLPCDDAILTGEASSLAWAVPDVRINGRRLVNRWAVQPMEGWDGTPAGGITDDVCRRWRRFGESGAGLICGGEAMAVRHDGRANPNQLVITPATRDGLAELVRIAREAWRERMGSDEGPVIGFQLTHSGRFCKPNDKARLEPRVAFRHPILDRRFGVTSDAQVFTDDELQRLQQDYVVAARVAREAGADFVDLKHCHGYLLHELLGAHTRPGPFGGSFGNRTRFLRDLVAAIRADGNPIEIGVRLSAFDFVPFRPDPARSQPGRPGPGVPEDFGGCLPYRYGFGVNPANPVEADLAEAFQFAELCVALGVKVLNLTAGSPYYNPHIQRPAMFPPSDGYQPPEDPLAGVARQIQAVRRIRQYLAGSQAGGIANRQSPIADGEAPAGAEDGSLPGIRNPESGIQSPASPVLVGSAYSYLQEYLPHVAQAVVRAGWVDVVGIGRAVLSYPGMLADAVRDGRLETRAICRTFSDCTTAPRNGMISGCYPLDRHYQDKPEAAQLKTLKRTARSGPV